MSGVDLDIPSYIHIVGNCPHDWIFEQVGCVVHRGGAGPTAAAMGGNDHSVVDYVSKNRGAPSNSRCVNTMKANQQEQTVNAKLSHLAPFSYSR